MLFFYEESNIWYEITRDGTLFAECYQKEEEKEKEEIDMKMHSGIEWDDIFDVFKKFLSISCQVNHQRCCVFRATTFSVYVWLIDWLIDWPGVEVLT